MFRFREVKIYQDGIRFHSKIVAVTRSFPREFQYLTDQVRRSSLSVALNIAEGSAKSSDKDFNRYVTIALGSINESMAACEIARRENLITDEQLGEIRADCEELSRQLGGFSKHLKSASKHSCWSSAVLR